MSDNGHDLPWSAEQWAELQQLVQNSARKARIASSFLPLHGPLPPGQATVPALEMVNERLQDRLQRWEPGRRLDIDDGKTLRLTTISCDVYVKSVQAEDPSLAAVRDLLARAADIIGRLEDAIVFNGNGENAAPVRPGVGPVRPFVSPAIYTVRNDDPNPGLLDPFLGREAAEGLDTTLRSGPYDVVGRRLLGGIVEAIQTLEEGGHYGPFACVLGSWLYRGATSPDPNSLVLPSDRIIPFLDGGPLLRASSIPFGRGVVVALAGAPVDLVVAKDVHVGFLQRSLEPRYVLRVSERFVLRIKQPEAIFQLVLDEEPSDNEDGPREGRDDGQ
jgi:hypothetical protein